MKQDKIKDAVAAAKEFIIRSEELDKAQVRTYECGGDIFHYSAPKESGALRRQSLELTRALAAMRKP